MRYTYTPYMTSVLYYSKHCEKCKSLIQYLSKLNTQELGIAFICIDRRVNRNGSLYVQLDNGKEIVLPPTVTQVPSLLLLNQGKGGLICGPQSIVDFIQPLINANMKKATHRNMEPEAFAFSGGGGSGILSDSFGLLAPDTVLKQDFDSKNGGELGTQQMHNYMDIHSAYEVPTNSIDATALHGTNQETTLRGTTKKTEESANSEMDMRMKQMLETRDNDMKMITGNRPPRI